MQKTVCSSCEKILLPNYYSLQQHRRKEHGAKQRKPNDTLADLNKIVEEKGDDGEKLKKELSAELSWWILRWKTGDIRYLTFKCLN